MNQKRGACLFAGHQATCIEEVCHDGVIDGVIVGFRPTDRSIVVLPRIAPQQGGEISTPSPALHVPPRIEMEHNNPFVRRPAPPLRPHLSLCQLRLVSKFAYPDDANTTSFMSEMAEAHRSSRRGMHRFQGHIRFGRCTRNGQKGRRHGRRIRAVLPRTSLHGELGLHCGRCGI